jgi:hypothetical protein
MEHTMRKRIKRPTLAKYSMLEQAMLNEYGVNHSGHAVMYAPTGGQASKRDIPQLSGLMVAKDEKLPPKLPKNTNTKGVHGGISTRPYLKEGLGQ